MVKACFRAVSFYKETALFFCRLILDFLLCPGIRNRSPEYLSSGLRFCKCKRWNQIRLFFRTALWLFSFTTFLMDRAAFRIAGAISGFHLPFVEFTFFPVMCRSVSVTWTFISFFTFLIVCFKLFCCQNLFYFLVQVITVFLHFIPVFVSQCLTFFVKIIENFCQFGALFVRKREIFLHPFNSVFCCFAAWCFHSAFGTCPFAWFCRTWVFTLGICCQNAENGERC